MAYKSESEVTMTRAEYEESLETVRAEVTKLRAENKRLLQVAIEQLARRLYQDHYAEQYSYKHIPTHRPFEPFLKDAASYINDEISTEWVRKDEYDKLRDALISRYASLIEAVEGEYGVGSFKTSYPLDEPSDDAIDRAKIELRAEGLMGDADVRIARR